MTRFAHVSTALRRSLSANLAAALLSAATLGAAPAQAHGGDAATGASTASSLALSLPVASVAATGLVVLSGAAALTVVAVQASAAGAVWVLERAVDGSRVVVQISGQAARGASVAVGQTLGVVALSTGLVLTASGEVLCFVPNAIGAPLLHHERLTF
jgi:hypothetical protein